MDIKKTVELDKEDSDLLRGLNDKQVGVQQWVQMVTQQGEQRVAQLQAEGRGIWSKIAEKYDLDLKKVHYNLDDSGSNLIATAVKLYD